MLIKENGPIQDKSSNLTISAQIFKQRAVLISKTKSKRNTGKVWLVKNTKLAQKQMAEDFDLQFFTPPGCEVCCVPQPGERTADGHS